MVGLVSGIRYGFWWVFVGGSSVVIATVVVWKRERYGGLSFGSCLSFGLGVWV